jgi:CubicO group peptidase (beta-lactamase class C family)
MTDGDQNIRELLQRAIRAGSAPGAVAAWRLAGGEVSVEALGYSRVLPERVEVSGETWFDLASLTKPLVTTTLTVLAFRSRTMAPTTRVGEVLTEARENEVGEVEVRHLLTHTAGLPAWLPLYCLAEGRRDLLVSRLAEMHLQAAPGEQVVYSCVGFVILGLMLERISDQDLGSLFRRDVLKVVGLEDQFGFHPDPAIQSLAGGAVKPAAETRLINIRIFDQRWLPATGHHLPDDGNARFLGGVAGNAGLFGTARGVVVLASEYLPGGGSLLSSAEAAEAITPRTKGLAQGRAWGWQLASTPGCSAAPGFSKASFGHTGFTGVSVWCDPGTRNVSALLTNRNHPAQRENDLHPLRRRFHCLASGRKPSIPGNEQCTDRS